MTFTNRHGQVIDDNPQDADSSGNEDLASIIAYPTGNSGVYPVANGDYIAGVDHDVAVEPAGVDIDKATEAYIPQDCAEPDYGLGHQDPIEPEHLITPPTDTPTVEPTTMVRTPAEKTASPRKGMTAMTARVRNPPKTYVPSIKGNKYAIALTQIQTILVESKDALCIAQRSVKLMSKCLHRCADIVGMIMAQLSLKAAKKKWGEVAEKTIWIEMKQLHWRNSYKPMHWSELTKAQKERNLESHIFVEEKRDDKIKARKVVGGNKERDYATMEDVSSPTVSAEAVMLTCIIDAVEGRNIVVIDVPNACVQTVVEDEEHQVIIHIRGPLVDILVSIAPEVYSSYVSTNKSGQKFRSCCWCNA